MRILIDTEEKQLVVEKAQERRTLDLYGKEAFQLLSDLWLKTSWNQKYSYTFTWMGRPIIQHPEDVDLANDIRVLVARFRFVRIPLGFVLDGIEIKIIADMIQLFFLCRQRLSLFLSQYFRYKFS